MQIPGDNLVMRHGIWLFFSQSFSLHKIISPKEFTKDNFIRQRQSGQNSVSCWRPHGGVNVCRMSFKQYMMVNKTSFHFLLLNINKAVAMSVFLSCARLFHLLTYGRTHVYTKVELCHFAACTTLVCDQQEVPWFHSETNKKQSHLFLLDGINPLVSKKRERHLA